VRNGVGLGSTHEQVEEEREREREPHVMGKAHVIDSNGGLGHGELEIKEDCERIGNKFNGENEDVDDLP
jgi:hypothetical protein